MAISTTVMNTQNVRVCMYPEATVGDGGVYSGYGIYELPLTAPPSWNDLSVPLETPSLFSGTYTKSWDKYNLNRTNQMTEISFSAIGTGAVVDLLCHFAFGDGNGVNDLTGHYKFPTRQQPTDFVNGSAQSESGAIAIIGGGYQDSARDVIYVGCILTSLVIDHSIDSEGGKPVATATFITGYNPSYSDVGSAGTLGGGTDDSGITKLSGDYAKDFSSHHEDFTWIENSGTGYEILPYSYSVSFNRAIERSGWNATFEPDTYLMTGEYENEMTMTYKRDLAMDNWLGNMRTTASSQCPMSIGDEKGSGNGGWNVYINGAISSHTVDSGNPELRNSITIKGMSLGLEASSVQCRICF